MPNLKEGIQYVGMLKPQMSEYDYIITDINGCIDSFTSGIGLLFNINPQLVKDSNTFNIQFLAPELIYYFRKRNSQKENPLQKSLNLRAVKALGNTKLLDNTRFSVPGGDKLTFYIPNNFMYIIKQD